MKTPSLTILLTLVTIVGLWANPHRLQPKDAYEIQGIVISWHKNAIVIETVEPPFVPRGGPHSVGINLAGVGQTESPYSRPPYSTRILFLQHPEYDSFEPGQKITLLGFPWPEKITIDGTEYLAYRMLRPEEVPIIENPN